MQSNAIQLEYQQLINYYNNLFRLAKLYHCIIADLSLVPVIYGFLNFTFFTVQICNGVAMDHLSTSSLTDVTS